MAQNNIDFYTMALKAVKQQGELAPVGSDARLLYQTKANSLRDTLKKMGYANVDADYGAGVSLANTPGGGKIDWNVLANAADILGTSQAGSTRSAFDRALGEYLTRNIPAWAKEAGKATSASSTITSTASSVMGGSGAAQAIVGGNAAGGTYDPTHPFTPTSVVPAAGGETTAVGSTTASGASSGPSTSIGALGQGGTGGGGSSIVPIPKPVEAAATGYEWTQPDVTKPWVQTKVLPTGTGAGMGSGAGLYGDFIQSSYFKNNDFDGYFLSVNKGMNLPTLTDPTTGKVTIDWANKTTPISSSVFTSYGNMTKLWNTLQGLSKTKDTFSATDIENNPVFKEQLNVLTAESDSLQKQFNLNVDAQLAGLSGSVDANKAGLEYELTTIKREIGASNWRSRQSLAASGMAFSGMLGYLYGQNEAKGMDATIKATSISAAEIKAIGAQMAILEGSKLSYASDLERLYGAKRALARATILDPQNTRLQEIGQLIDQGIADFETEKGLVAPAAELTARGDAAAATTAASEDAKWWVTMTVNALDKGISIVQNADGTVTLTQVLSAKEILDFNAANPGMTVDATGKITGTLVPTTAQIAGWLENGIIYDAAKGTLTHKMTPAEAETNRHNIEVERISKLTQGQQAAQNAETKRHNGVMEGISQQNANTAAAGSSGTDANGNPVYDQKPDLSVLSNSGASPASIGLASTHLMAGTGAVSEGTLGEFLSGTTYYWDAAANGGKGGWGPNQPVDTKRNPITTQSSKFPGFLALSETEMYNTLDLIDDPIMAGVSWALWAAKNNQGTGYEQTIDLWATNNKWTPAQKQSALSVLNKYQSSIGAP